MDPPDITTAASSLPSTSPTPDILQNSVVSIVDNEDPSDSEKILTRFPSSPPEVRCMIYACMVDEPRLLHLNRLRSHPVTTRSSLVLRAPNSQHLVSLFLNKEAHEETKRQIKVVPQATNNNIVDFPFSYICPKLDILYCSYLYLRDIDAQKVPGIQKLAINIECAWTSPKSRFRSGKTRDLNEKRELVRNIHKFPDVKEILLVRELYDLCTSSEFAGPEYVFANEGMQDVEKRVPAIKKHSCGFFGVINDEIENIFPEVLPPIDQDDQTMPYHQPSDKIIRSVTEALTTLNDQMFPGTTLPPMTGVYDYWLEDGVWKNLD